MKCDDSCKTCASSSITFCTSCYNSYALVSSSCVKCNDPNALVCPININVAIKCVVGYSPILGSCVQCAANCTECGIAGAGQCDGSQCALGYTKLYGTTNCTKCINSCASCSQYDPSVCFSCSFTDYLDNSSSCQACPSVCKTCSSLTTCLSCPSGYVFYQNWCYATLSYPCSAQIQSTCTQCFAPYYLSIGSCVIDTSCNATSTCISCPLNYYLSSNKCLPCLTDSTLCNYCKPTDPSVCLACIVGYYLGADSTCVACSTAQTGCSKCSTGNVCSQVYNGYYLELDAFGLYTGSVLPCNPKCGTCSYSNTCDTCATGYQRYGTTCLYNLNIIGSLLLGPG